MSKCFLIWDFFIIIGQLSIAQSLQEEELSLDLDASHGKILMEQDSIDGYDIESVDRKQEDDKGGGTDDEIDEKKSTDNNDDEQLNNADLYASIEIGSVSEGEKKVIIRI